MKVNSWVEADAALAELGRLDEELARIEKERTEALQRAEGQAAERGRLPAARREKLIEALEAFCRQRSLELSRRNGHERRSRRLLFGRVGYRRTQAVAVRSEAAALRRLAPWREGQQFLRVRAELDREALRHYLLKGRDGEETRPVTRRLHRAGIVVEQRENWFYEVNPTKLSRWG